MLSIPYLGVRPAPKVLSYPYPPRRSLTVLGITLYVVVSSWQFARCEGKAHGFELNGAMPPGGATASVLSIVS